jgi:uncharacterized protein YbjT (DUF2867 family)
MQPPSTALVAGATGLVGREILARLLADPSISAVHALARRDLPFSHPKLTVHKVDFGALPALPAVHEGYLALGTTIKVAGSQAAFRKVDFDANLAVAGALRAAGCHRVGLVSAMGAHALSAVFYNRVKGELEDALAALEFHTLAIARPSFLTGDRESLGQPVRAGEKLALRVSRLLAPVIPRNYASITAQDVAAALIAGVRGEPGRHVLLSGAMQGAASR